ncbi:hypothetical protein VD0003_g7417 [Verticillium dahliae]|nr:hypothetical protein VD0003_g7417 [Verticillium dahliae]
MEIEGQQPDIMAAVVTDRAWEKSARDLVVLMGVAFGVVDGPV